MTSCAHSPWFDSFKNRLQISLVPRIAALWSMTQNVDSLRHAMDFIYFFRRFSVPTMKIHSTFFSTNKTPPKIERRKMFRIAAKNSDVDANVENVWRGVGSVRNDFATFLISSCAYSSREWQSKSLVNNPQVLKIPNIDVEAISQLLFFWVFPELELCVQFQLCLNRNEEKMIFSLNWTSISQPQRSPKLRHVLELFNYSTSQARMP